MFCKKHLATISELQSRLYDSLAIEQAIDRSMAVIKFDTNGNIVHANENFYSVTGYSATELVGNHHRVLCDEAYANSDEYKNFWQHLARGEFHSGTVKRRHKNGQNIWLEATYNPILDNQNNVISVVKFAADVTQQVEESASRNAMVNAIERSMAVIEFDLHGIILRANSNFYNTMGYDPQSTVGHHHRMFCSHEYASSDEYKEFWARLGRGEYITGTFSRLNRHGEQIWLEASYNPVLGPDGLPVKIVKFATDVTHQILSHEAQKNSAQTAYQVAIETLENSQQGEKTILSTVDKMHAIETVVSKSSEEVKLLGEDAVNITSIVNTIREIAEQTNLLALNAAIEAARAGETGRGFAVVADEVRNLANRTNEATGEISDMIKAINDKSQSVSETMEQGLSEVTEGVQMVNKAGDTIKQMRDGATQVVRVVQDLSNSVSSS